MSKLKHERQVGWRGGFESEADSMAPCSSSRIWKHLLALILNPLCLSFNSTTASINKLVVVFITGCDSQLCGIPTFALFVTTTSLLFLFLYFDVLQVVPTGLLLNTAALRLYNLNAESRVQSFKFSPPSNHSVSSDTTAANIVPPFNSSNREFPGDQAFSVGRWVIDRSYPLYRSEACPFIDDGFRCQENGRQDNAYLKWRWQPSNSGMPWFDAKDMLERLRGSRLVFVGDSIGRNQWESMMCMLAEVVENKSRIYEVNGEPITKHKGFLSFRFADYNCTVEYYRSPFLVPQGHPPIGSPKEVRLSLRVDIMDWSSRFWHNADILVFNAGHWWSYEKTLRGGCYFQEGPTVNTSMDIRTAFGKAMKAWTEWVEEELGTKKTQILFRSYAPAHFSGGTWRTGGQCHEETEPEAEAVEEGSEPWTNPIVFAEIQRINRTNVQFLNITHLSNYRKDGHPSIYHVGKDEPRPLARQDCSHWCLPGVPDAWNELLYATLLTCPLWRSSQLM